MAVSNEYGPIVTGTQVRDALRLTLQTWFAAYADELGRQTALVAPLPPFADWQAVVTEDEIMAGPLPLLVITSPGAARTEAHGDAATGVWTVGAGVVVGAQDWNTAFALGEAYAAVIRAIALQHGALGGTANGVHWVGESYDEFRHAEQVGAVIGVMVTFEVFVDQAVNPRKGPRTPPSDPGIAPQWPQVESTNVTVTRES